MDTDGPPDSYRDEQPVRGSRRGNQGPMGKTQQREPDRWNNDEYDYDDAPSPRKQHYVGERQVGLPCLNKSHVL